MSGFQTLAGQLSILAAEEGGGGVEFPSINLIVKWPNAFGDGTFYGFNKIALISLIAMIVPFLLFFLAGRKAKLVPGKLQNVAEVAIDFVEKQVILPAIGKEGMRYLPMLTAMVFFIWIGNLFEVIPTSHMPANARMANPLMLAIVAWVMFIGVGVKHNGLGYFKSALFPPGVPKALYLLVTPIELLSTFIIRPFSLAVRLFANMLAGHILLVTFSVLCITLWSLSPLVIVTALSFPMLVAFTGFEFMVAFLQAFIFALLTAVYIGGALHPEH
ncbi:MAG: F0F1 ATP synthase subunit A [Actinobacteria bacterium]|jgi:F-type H+-transporting ATPase subunit a|nr:F0F1 ATP synthase subunit A [Actinomycetota bacterium]